MEIYYQNLGKILGRTPPQEKVLEECDHLTYQRADNNWCICDTCKEVFQIFELVSEPESEMQVYRLPYDNVSNFRKYLRKISKNINNMEEQPMINGFLQFMRAYRKCTFRSHNKIVGKTRNIIGVPYTIFRIAGILAIHDAKYRALVEASRAYLPGAKRLQILDNHWKQLESHLPQSWLSNEPKPLRYRPRVIRKSCVPG